MANYPIALGILTSPLYQFLMNTPLIALNYDATWLSEFTLDSVTFSNFNIKALKEEVVEDTVYPGALINLE